MKKLHDKQDELFYATYANLIAGLLFIFLFILAAILIKNTYTKSEFENTRQSLNEEKAKFEAEKDEFKQSQAFIYELGKRLKNTDTSSLNAKDEGALVLLADLDKKEEKLKNFKDNFKQLKQEIMNLELAKNNLILELQAKFDSNITLNTKTGSLVLFNESLFNQGSYILKNEVKPRLRTVLSEYFNAILQDKELYKSIDNITIQSYVGDEGYSFAHKIDLSSKRASELMNFIFSFYKDKRLHKLLLASGRVLSPLEEDGKILNSRIEIDFSLSNDFILEKMEDFFNKQ